MRLKQKTTNKKPLFIIGSIIFLLLITGGIIYFTHSNNKSNSPTTNGLSSSPKPEPSNPTNSSGSPSNTKDPTNSNTPVQTPLPSVIPQTPTGTFVSNHHPNLSNSPSPSAMSSACTTTVGASCKISFTNGATTLNLPNKITDANGSVVWNWNLQDIGLTEGSWTVTAIATNGDKSASSVDLMLLEVRQ